MKEIKIDSRTFCYSASVGFSRPIFNGYILKGEKHDLGIDPTLLHLKAWEGGAFPQYILLTRLDLTTIGAVHELDRLGYPGVILLHDPQLESAQNLLPHSLRFQSIKAETGIKVGTRLLKILPIPIPPHSPCLGLYDPETKQLFSSLLFSYSGENQEPLGEYWPDEGFESYEEKETGPWPWDQLSRILPDWKNILTILPAAGAPFHLSEGKLPLLVEKSRVTRLAKNPNKGSMLPQGTCLEVDVNMDRITGLPNEEAFKARCRSHLISENKTKGGILILLPDRLKEINARYGRAGGDEALQAFTWVLKSTLEPEKLQAYKLNGPYFVILFEDKEPEAMETFANQLREASSTSKTFYESLTASLGMATLVEATEKEDNPKEILDKIMTTAIGRTLLAARQGGNTVCSTSTPRELKEISAPKVLLIEPDPAYGLFLKEYLNSRGYSILLAHTGLEGLELARLNKPRAIISETMVPQLSGFRIREELHQDSQLNDIPFILLSHRKTEDFIKKALQLRILWYLKKPASLVELEGLLNLILHQGPYT